METRKKVAVLGLRDTGYRSALFLAGRGYQVFASDNSSARDILSNVESLRDQGIEAECGRHTREKIFNQDWVLVSPGIPPSCEIYQEIRAAGKPVYSEIEVASWFNRSGCIVAVTGSCGKTTTATLIARLLDAGGRRAVLCGNIGNPWIGELSRIGPETVVVLELSSFQLMHCVSFVPDIGLLLNIYPNHMDWHADMHEYAGAKLNLFRAMGPSGLMICRKADEARFFPGFRTYARRVYFDQRPAPNPNEAALLCVAEALDCSGDLARKVIDEFGGIEHRLEKFAHKDGVDFINDSKATTTASLAWALEKYPDRKVVLVCGGKLKTDIKDFEALREIVSRTVRCAILIGSARPVIKAAWQGATEILDAGDLEEACRLSLEKCRAGDTVILSPACSSFDMFKDYRERGRVFKETILSKLKTEPACRVRGSGH